MLGGGGDDVNGVCRFNQLIFAVETFNAKLTFHLFRCRVVGVKEAGNANPFYLFPVANMKFYQVAKAKNTNL